MDLLAQGMGVDPPGVGVNGEVPVEEQSGMEGEVNGIGGVEGERVLGGKGVVLTPGSAEEWIARQGHEGMLLC